MSAERATGQVRQTARRQHPDAQRATAERNQRCKPGLDENFNTQPARRGHPSTVAARAVASRLGAHGTNSSASDSARQFGRREFA